MKSYLAKSRASLCAFAVTILLCGLPQLSQATTTTYELTNGWAPYGNENGVYFYKPGAAFYGNFETGSMFLDLTQTDDTTYEAKVYGSFVGNFQTQNGQLSVNPSQNASQFNSTEGVYSIEMAFTLSQLFPHKYPNNVSTLSQDVVGSITNPLGVSSTVSLAFAEKHGIAFGLNFLDDGSIHAAGWFNVAGGSNFSGVHGDFYFNGSQVERSEVPEPTSLALLGFGALTILRRRVI